MGLAVHVEAFVSTARSGMDGQAELMLRYISRAGLMPALRNRDWKAFARGYNGPAYRKNRYDSRMAEAYARYGGGKAQALRGEADRVPIRTAGWRARLPAWLACLVGGSVR